MFFIQENNEEKDADEDPEEPTGESENVKQNHNNEAEEWGRFLHIKDKVNAFLLSILIKIPFLMLAELFIYAFNGHLLYRDKIYNTTKTMICTHCHMSLCREFRLSSVQFSSYSKANCLSIGQLRSHPRINECIHWTELKILF